MGARAAQPKNTQKKSPGDAAGRGANGLVAAATGADEDGGATEAALEELGPAVAEGEAAGLPRQVLQAARAKLAVAEELAARRALARLSRRRLSLAPGAALGGAGRRGDGDVDDEHTAHGLGPRAHRILTRGEKHTRWSQEYMPTYVCTNIETHIHALYTDVCVNAYAYTNAYIHVDVHSYIYAHVSARADNDDTTTTPAATTAGLRALFLGPSVTMLVLFPPHLLPRDCQGPWTMRGQPSEGGSPGAEATVGRDIAVPNLLYLR